MINLKLFCSLKDRANEQASWCFWELELSLQEERDIDGGEGKCVVRFKLEVMGMYLYWRMGYVHVVGVFFLEI